MTNTFDYQSSYPNLSAQLAEIFPQLSRPQNGLTLQKACKDLPIKHDFDYSQLLFAILPVANPEKRPLNLVITHEEIHLVDRRQSYILNQVFSFHEHIPFDNVFKKVLQDVLKDCGEHHQYSLPMTCWRYSLLQVKSSPQWCQRPIWINPATLVDFIGNRASNTTLSLSYGLLLESPVAGESLRHSIREAAIAHGLMLRKRLTHHPVASCKLTAFLEYPSLPFVNLVLEELTFFHLPGQRNQLMTSYQHYAIEAALKKFMEKEEKAQQKRLEEHRQKERLGEKHPCYSCGRE